MRIGVQTFFSAQEKSPLGDFIAGVGKILEEREFHGIWMSEHVVTFRSYDPTYPYPYSDDGVPPAILSEMGMIDPMSALTVLATHTQHLRLGTGIAILPQRNPVYFAKMAAAIDLLSNGRFVAGVGLGWSAQEFKAVQTPFERRGSRMRDYIQVVRSLWCDDTSRFEGEFYSLPACIHLPKPVQKPHPPFYFGGESKAAFRRVAEFGQGWVGFRLTPEELTSRLKALGEILGEYGRSIEDIDIVVSPGADRVCDADMLARYGELGVAEVVVVCLGDSLDAYSRQADRLTRSMVLPASRM